MALINKDKLVSAVDCLMDDIMKSFSDSGIMHLLALSGLHIGILTWLLSLLLSPFLLLKHGVVFRSILVVLLLWLYAFLTGFSSSILRATVMFSIFTIAHGLKRGSNVYNSIAVSALIILVINPNYLSDVGFQLSFAAVIGIVWMFPILENIGMPKNAIMKYFWGLVLVSVVAQIATLPLSIFYFHKFSSTFLVANIVEIPLVTVLLVISYFFVGLLLIGIQLDFMSIIIDYLTDLIQNASEYISSFTNFIYTDLYIDKAVVLVLYLILMSFLIAIQKKGVRYLFLILLLILTLQILKIEDKYINYSTSKVMIAGGRYADVILKKGNIAFTSKSIEQTKFYDYIKTHKLRNKDSISTRLFYFDGKLYWSPKEEVEYNPLNESHSLIISNEAESNPNLTKNKFTESVILTAYSNSIVKRRWEHFCDKKKIAFYCTSDSLYVADVTISKQTSSKQEGDQKPLLFR
jgi:competence protein ComEC